MITDDSTSDSDEVSEGMRSNTNTMGHSLPVELERKESVLSAMLIQTSSLTGSDQPAKQTVRSEVALKNDELRMVTSRIVPSGCRFIKFITPKVVVPGSNTMLCMLTIGTNIWGGCEDGSICVWNAQTREFTSEMKIHTRGVTDLLLVGDTMWSASKDGTIGVWELATRKHKKTLSTEGEILSMAFVKSISDTVWTGSRRSVFLWSANDVRLIKEIIIGGPVHAIAQIGKLVWLCSDGIERWNAETLKRQDHIMQGTPIFSLAVVDNQAWASCADGSVVVLHSESAEFLNRLDFKLTPPVTLLAYGTYVFGGSGDNRIMMWNKKTHEFIHEVHEEVTSQMAPLAVVNSPTTDHVQLWCGRSNKFMSIWAFKDYLPAPISLSNFPNYEVIVPVTQPLAFLTGPDAGIAKNGHPNRSKVATQYLAGQSLSTFEKSSNESLVVDCFVVDLLPNGSIIGISDGVKAGVPSRNASVAGLTAATEFLRTRLGGLKDKKPKVQDLISLLFNSVKAGHQAILNLGAGTADVCLGLVVRLYQENELSPSWAFLGANLGVNKCYCWSNRTKKVTEITCLLSKGSIGIGDKGPMEVLMASTYNSDTALVSYFYPCEDGDIIFMLSDGLHSNFDPEVLRSSPSCLGFTTSNWSALAVLSPEEMQHRKQLFLEDLITDLLGDATMPRAMVDRLMDFVVEVTMEKREFMEKFSAIDQRKLTRQARVELRDVLKKMRGRLGHATCVAVKVGEFTSKKNVRHSVKPSGGIGFQEEEFLGQGFENQAMGLPFAAGGLATFMEMEGYLSKMGGKLQIWQQRYFILRENVIRILKKPKDKKAKGEIVITSHTKVLLLADEFEVVEKNGKKKKFKKPDVFVLSAGGRDYYLHALTKGEACNWVEAINHNRSLL